MAPETPGSGKDPEENSRRQVASAGRRRQGPQSGTRQARSEIEKGKTSRRERDPAAFDQMAAQTEDAGINNEPGHAPDALDRLMGSAVERP